jgi:hypothetical protein
MKGWMDLHQQESACRAVCNNIMHVPSHIQILCMFSKTAGWKTNCLADSKGEREEACVIRIYGEEIATCGMHYVLADVVYFERWNVFEACVVHIV